MPSIPTAFWRLPIPPFSASPSSCLPHEHACLCEGLSPRFHPKLQLPFVALLQPPSLGSHASARRARRRSRPPQVRNEYDWPQIVNLILSRSLCFPFKALYMAHPEARPSPSLYMPASPLIHPCPAGSIFLFAALRTTGMQPPPPSPARALFRLFWFRDSSLAGVVLRLELRNQLYNV